MSHNSTAIPLSAFAQPIAGVPGARTITARAIRAFRVLASLFLFLAATRLLAETQQNADTNEIASQESQPSFNIQAQRNLVIVRVVVRDRQGRLMPNLKKEDFRLLDNNKPQTISHFSVESHTGAPTRSGAAPKTVDTEAVPENELAERAAQRYLALYFDDTHMEFGDIVRTRDAAQRYLDSNLQPSDRVGIFDSSGQYVLDFTDDREKLKQAFLRLQPRPQRWLSSDRCPQILPYQAYQIVHERDPYATEIATEEAFYCECSNVAPQQQASCRTQAGGIAEAEAVRILNESEQISHESMRGLEVLIRRMRSLPGQRSIVLLSPGFFSRTEQSELDEITNQALRANVIINALDSKGLYAPVPFGDASHTPLVIPSRPDLAGRKAQIKLDELALDLDVMRVLSNDTGGVFFHNSNDIDEGFRRVGGFPEVTYVLAFTPTNLKYDGAFHLLKVQTPGITHVDIAARHGYYAPKEAPDAAAQEAEEVQDAMFSRDEMNELPLDVHTQFFKVNDVDAKLSILMHLDLKVVRFRKAEGRNVNKLDIVVALFDNNGNYLTGKEKRVDFHLRDGTLERLEESGIRTKTSFDVKPGTYTVRAIVREAEGAHFSAVNRTVEIP